MFYADRVPHNVHMHAAIDTAAFSVASMFHTNNIALDIFGDADTSNSRRRCQPTTPEEASLFDLHLRVAIMYTFVYAGLQGMPYCFDLVDPLMSAAGHPLSLVMLEDSPSVETPWGLAKAYVDEVIAFLTANDGWNADGSKSRDYNRTPFSDYSITDSAGNSWTPYTSVGAISFFRRFIFYFIFYLTSFIFGGYAFGGFAFGSFVLDGFAFGGFVFVQNNSSMWCRRADSIVSSYPAGKYCNIFRFRSAVTDL